MVEVENQWIGFAAVDTWMLLEERHEPAQIRRDVSCVVPLGIGDIGGAVPKVVVAIPLRVALAAIAVKDTLGHVLEAELPYPLDRAAACTEFLTFRIVHAIV